MEMKDIVTAFIGMIALYIAHQQWKISQDKLRVDLYDRRFKVYEETKSILSVFVRKGMDYRIVDLNLQCKCWTVLEKAEFLFEPDIPEYLNTIRKRIDEIETKQAELSEISSRIRVKEIEFGSSKADSTSIEELQAEETDLKNKLQKHFEWCREQSEKVLKDKFNEYLSFEHMQRTASCPLSPLCPFVPRGNTKNSRN
jgi:hypothetical protein